jgi:UDP-N-acetylmuramate dehydrogenase
MFSLFLKDLTRSKINYNISKKTWFGTGGNAKIFTEMNSVQSLTFFLKILPKSVPIFLIGAGSNTIIRDGGINGFTIKLGKYFKKIDFDKKNKIVEIGAAVKDLDFLKFCYNNSIGGFEYLKGIPGTIGGNLRMNAGCYGKTISDNFKSCKIVNRNGKILELKKSEIRFGYRSCSIPFDSIIISAKFRVDILGKKKILKVIKENSEKRNSSQPTNYRTGGSTFKNPPNHEAWKLIDKINFRGKKRGGANVSTKHTNFLINSGKASSLDLELLGEEIRDNVKKKFNIKLNWELIRVGSFKKI